METKANFSLRRLESLAEFVIWKVERLKIDKQAAKDNRAKRVISPPWDRKVLHHLQQGYDLKKKNKKQTNA